MPGFLSSFIRLGVVFVLLCFAIFLMALPYLSDANAGMFCAPTADGVLYCTDDLDYAPSALTFTERTGTLKDYARYTPLGHQVASVHKWAVPAPVVKETSDEVADRRFIYDPYAPRVCIGPHQHAWSNLPVSDCGDGFGPGPNVGRDGTLVVPHALRILNRRPPILRVQLVP